MGAWTWPVTDLRTNTLVHDNLPLRVDGFTDGLGLANGALSGRLPLRDGIDDLLAPKRRVIWPCRNRQPFGAYLVTALSPYGPKSTAVEFTAERIDSILIDREIESTLVFRAVDQLEIVRDLIRYGLGRPTIAADTVNQFVFPLPAADVAAIRLDDSQSGVRRDRLDDDAGFQAARHPKVSEMVKLMSELEDVGARAAAGLTGSLDYRLDYDRDSSGFYATIRLGYPRLGGTDTVPLEYPGNILDWTFAADTADTETASRVYGAGQGVEKGAGAPAYDYTALAEGWPLLMGSESSTASDQGTLDAASRARATRLRGANQGWTVQLRKEALGTYDIGDTTLMHIRNRRWPLGKRALVRITGHRIEPSRQGKAERIIPTVVEV